MKISQARVSAIERGEVDSLTVASIQSYVSALGGSVDLVAILDDTAVSLRLPVQSQSGPPKRGKSFHPDSFQGVSDSAVSN
jgi:hypothetical protein